jgi:hypothetical protein
MDCPDIVLWTSMLSFECGFEGNGTYIENVLANVGTEMLAKLQARVFALLESALDMVTCNAG